ncbi:Meiotically up-regulated protein [Escovopsis weberi]|uniref:Meiotically up-regulated protein n=1 Tax=Escovopsis weberi TaxID=150374 RepID=A0A0M9VUV4_ESCWE|nr:Meiotically up-regulated protein [Escovopsis weberi]
MTSTASDDAPHRGDAQDLASHESSSLDDTSLTSVTDTGSDKHRPSDDDHPTPSPSSPVPSTPSTPSTPPTPVDLQARTLDFFANASPTTLLGVSIAGLAFLYAVLGRLGLVLIGAILGVSSYVYWESNHPELARAVSQEQGKGALDRLWTELKNAQLQDGASAAPEDELPAVRSFDDFQPETREALGALVDAIIQNYVKWWYTPIIPSDHSFPMVCRKVLISYIISISNRMARKRPADAFLDLLTNSSSMIIVFFSELATAFSELPPDSNLTAIDTVYNYLAEHPDSRLTDLLNQRQQNAKFKMVAEDLLGFLDKNSYNCDPVRTFLREILANSVLETTLQQCSRAEWINQWIVYLLEAGESDLNQAIDVGMQTGRDMTNSVFADMDGNVGNVSIPKGKQGASADPAARRKDSKGNAHKKKLSRAEEELEEAMEDMKRMNAMIAEDNARRERAATVTGSSERSKDSVDLTSRATRTKSVSPGEAPFSSVAANFDTHGPSTDALSTKSDTIYTPLTTTTTTTTSSNPGSVGDPASQEAPASPSQQSQQAGDQHFTSFDQIVPPANPEAEEECPKKAELTLHNATFTLHDDSAGETGKIRSKPNTDYLIQVEPSSAAYPGWMIVRRYSDFETLHEILRRIATVSGASAFAELHQDLPSWKMHTKESLRGELERYLRDACWSQTLAESEGMKRFLEKSQGHTHANSKTFAWDTVGKNMLDVLSGAPKGAMEGGKNFVGGMSGVFAGLGRKSALITQSSDTTPSTSRLSLSASLRENFIRSPAKSDRASIDSQRSSVISSQPGKATPMERRPSLQSQDGEGEGGSGRTGHRDRVGSVSASGRASREHSRAPSSTKLRSPSLTSLDISKLPPPPDEMADDYGSPIVECQANLSESLMADQQGPPASDKKEAAAPKAHKFARLSESETRVAVELIFAVINEMYTLSSAWNIRRTLLAAAKSFLLRPGNPSLLTVQSLIQSSVLDANTSDRGIAAQLRGLRASVMPTVEERAGWPGEMAAGEREKLAARARQLLIQSGVPAALTGVMGQAATGEALGRVFDCLQIEEVARGLIFGLILQFVRVITH